MNISVNINAGSVYGVSPEKNLDSGNPLPITDTTIKPDTGLPVTLDDAISPTVCWYPKPETDRAVCERPPKNPPSDVANEPVSSDKRDCGTKKPVCESKCKPEEEKKVPEHCKASEKKHDCSAVGGKDPKDGITQPPVKNPDKEPDKSKDGSLEARLTEIVNSFKTMMEGFLKQIRELIETIKKPSPPVEGGQNPVPEKPGKPGVGDGASSPKETFAVRVPKVIAKGSSGQINEADIQAGVASYQLYQKSEAAEQAFVSKREELISQGVDRAESIKKALIYTQEKNLISKKEADFVYSISFQAAQIDDDPNTVSIASQAGNGTIDYGHGLKAAEIFLANVVNANVKVESRSLYEKV
ncbi:MAG TPA: hypothetical protein PKA63_06755 [Oligoflexia bacterium]|nr:hypothetical protein [Oligoflexia bacterium]HMP48349.1 hypothetical protein [Oligoflexia bacterium]